MSSRRSLSLIVVIVIGALTACNWTVGECWRRGERGEGSEGVGAGFGEGRSDGAGAGDFGDAPGDDEPLQCNKTRSSPKPGPNDFATLRSSPSGLWGRWATRRVVQGPVGKLAFELVHRPGSPHSPCSSSARAGRPHSPVRARTDPCTRQVPHARRGPEHGRWSQPCEIIRPDFRRRAALSRSQTM
jgi:hypothetical protein